MRTILLSLLRRAGKGETPVVAVFGVSPESCRRAVIHVRAGEPHVPIWLFSTAPPFSETAGLCERVYVHRNALRLFSIAQRGLWRRRLALSVGAWTGEPAGWAVRLAPFCIPPFRALLLNRHGDFFPGTPACVCRHLLQNARDRSRTAARAILDFSGALALWLLAAIVRCCGYPHRAWFARLHGRDALTLDALPAAGTGYATFVQSGTEWDGASFESFARSSSEPFILWCNRADPGAGEDLQSFVQSTPAFAVSRQSGVRAWKPLLLPTAPFRALQPGEAARVLAPCGNVILVDRRKLLALGVPRSALPGVAWMLIFWKAAAAGWQSYSIGQRKALGEQPDSPVEETAFLLRVASDPGLRRLAPRDSDLSRGTIAFSIGRPVPPDSGRLKVLLVSPFLPYPLTHGGAVRVFHLCRELSPRVDMVLVTMRETSDVVDYGQLHKIFRAVYVVDRDEPASAVSHWPRQVRETQSRSMGALITQLAHTWKPDLLQVEYTHMAHFREYAPHVPAILVEHDLTFTLYQQLAGRPGATSADREEYDRWLSYESHWLSNYDAVWTVSREDARTAAKASRRDSERIFVVPNGVDIERYSPREEPSPQPEIFFIGSFRHLPNVLGFDALRREVMPRVWREFPNAILRVVAGPGYEDYWRAFAGPGHSPAFDPRVQLHGYVEDVRPLYARATAVAVPLEVSAGTNIKVLEAMGCGKAVVTTPAGCAGLALQNGRDVLIDAGWKGFSHSICALFADPCLRERISGRARRTVEERFSWQSIAASAYSSYQLVGQPITAPAGIPFSHGAQPTR